MPSLFFPNMETGMDDQLARCNVAVEEGWGIVLEKRTSEEIKISRLAFQISKLFGKKITLHKTKIAEGSTKRRCPNISKIKKLGFRQKYNLNLGLRKTVNWHK